MESITHTPNNSIQSMNIKRKENGDGFKFDPNWSNKMAGEATA